jgi:hypothetical protein
MQDRQGGCLCGAVRYVLKGEPQAAAICHCTHCQKQSGSLFSFNLFISEAHYEQRGETIVYEDRGDSGHPSYRHYCGSCGSPIITKVSTLPGRVQAKAGTLDSMEGYGRRKPRYIPIVQRNGSSRSRALRVLRRVRDRHVQA